MKIRCKLDGLMLEAVVDPDGTGLTAFDGGEAFQMEALEARFYELVSATAQEIIKLERAHYRLLRYAPDFERGIEAQT
jgi:hypothetical protein